MARVLAQPSKTAKHAKKWTVVWWLDMLISCGIDALASALVVAPQTFGLLLRFFPSTIGWGLTGLFFTQARVKSKMHFGQAYLIFALLASAFSALISWFVFKVYPKDWVMFLLAIACGFTALWIASTIPEANRENYSKGRAITLGYLPLFLALVGLMVSRHWTSFLFTFVFADVMASIAYEQIVGRFKIGDEEVSAKVVSFSTFMPASWAYFGLVSVTGNMVFAIVAASVLSTLYAKVVVEGLIYKTDVLTQPKTWVMLTLGSVAISLASMSF